MTLRTPWVRRAEVKEGEEYLDMVSYFRLKGLRIMPRFLWNSLRIERQLLASQGLLGHSSGARLKSLEFWSITVWEDEEALQRFVHARPHTGIMQTMRVHVARSEFIRWKVAEAGVPPDVEEAEDRLHKKRTADDAAVA